MNPSYQRALQQIDELITRLRSNGDTSCAVAEQEDLILTRLSKLKYTLKPDDTQAINRINRYYRETKK